MSDSARELEIKYSMPGWDALNAAWNRFASIVDRIGDPETLRERSYHVTTRYYDTEGFDLLKAGTVLRKMDSFQPYFRGEVQIKTETRAQAACLDRREYAFETDEVFPDLSAVTDPAARDLLAPLAGRRWDEVFRTVNERRDLRITFNLESARETFEISVEKCDFIDSKTNRCLASIFEMEIEYKPPAGHNANYAAAANVLTIIGDNITDGLPDVARQPRSKAAIGYGFYTTHP